MDLLTLFIGLAIGLIVGVVVTWIWATSIAKAKCSATQSSENEVKELLAQQARNHLDVSRESIKILESELNRLLSSVKEYELSLNVSTEDYSQSTFFGEHTSMFLRNTEDKSSKIVATESIDNQPKDFANSGSGVFVGAPAVEKTISEEKPHN